MYASELRLVSVRAPVIAVLVVAALFVGEGSIAGDAVADPLRIVSLSVIANPENVLSAELEVSTSEPTAATLHVSGPGVALKVPAVDAEGTSHRLSIVGLLADTTYEVWVVATNRRGESVSSVRKTFTTGSLPSDLPPIEVTSDPLRMARGVTLFTVSPVTRRRRVRKQRATIRGNLIAVDAHGNVVWYYPRAKTIGDHAHARERQHPVRVRHDQRA